MAPDDSTRCIRCRSHTPHVTDDGANPAFPLCPYCEQALAGNVTIIDTPIGAPKTTGPAKKRPRPGATRNFWKKRREVTGR